MIYYIKIIDTFAESATDCILVSKAAISLIIMADSVIVNIITNTVTNARKVATIILVKVA